MELLAINPPPKEEVISRILENFTLDTPSDIFEKKIDELKYLEKRDKFIIIQKIISEGIIIDTERERRESYRQVHPGEKYGQKCIRCYRYIQYWNKDPDGLCLSCKEPFDKQLEYHLKYNCAEDDGSRDRGKCLWQNLKMLMITTEEYFDMVGYDTWINGEYWQCNECFCNTLPTDSLSAFRISPIWYLILEMRVRHVLYACEKFKSREISF